MRKRNVLRVVFLVLAATSAAAALSMVLASSQDPWIEFRLKYGAQRSMIRLHPVTKLPVQIDDLDILLPGVAAQAVPNQNAVASGTARFLRDNRSLLKIDVERLRLQRIKKVGRNWYVTYNQIYDGIPVYRVKVGAVISAQGKIRSLSSDYIPEIKVDVAPQIEARRAGEIAAQSLPPADRGGLSVKKERLVVFPKAKRDGPGYDFHLAWNFLLQGDKPDALRDIYACVDAHNGALLLKYKAYVDQTMHGTVSGQIYPARPTDALVTRNFTNETVQVVGGGTGQTNASGIYSIAASAGNHTVTSRLEGPFASVTDQSTGALTHTQAGTTAGSVSWTWAQDPATAVDESDVINVFYHLNQMHDQFYLGVLGYSWNNAWTGTAQMRAQVNYAYSNAFAGDPMQFGIDCFARSSDIVYHEATHNVLYDIFGDWIGFSYGSGTEGYAMDEGFADYFACAFTNDSLQGEGCGGGRNLNNTLQYPVPYSGEGHSNGRIIAGAAWDLRSKFAIPAADADRLTFEALNDLATYAAQYYFSDPAHSNLLASYRRADDDNGNLADGTPHDREIVQAFRNHGMLPYDVYCRDSGGDVGNVPSPDAFWTSPDIAVDAPPYFAGSGDPPHENAELGAVNKVHIRVRNLGYLTVPQCVVKLYWANPSTGLSWPADWHLIGQGTITNLAPARTVPDGDKVVLNWTPAGTGTGHRGLLVRLETPDDPMTEEGNVPWDNNIAQKNIEIVGPSFLAGDFLEFSVRENPFGLKRIRNLRVVLLDAPDEVQAVLHMPEQARIDGPVERATLIRKKLDRPWGQVRAVAEISAPSGQREFLIPRVFSERAMPVRVGLRTPAGFVLRREFTVRIIEEKDGRIVGGIDFLVRPE